MEKINMDPLDPEAPPFAIQLILGLAVIGGLVAVFLAAAAG